MPVTVRFAVLVALAITGGACKKSGDALLVVSVTSAKPVEVSSLDVTISTVTEAGPARMATVEYPSPDGGTMISATTAVTLGVTLPPGTGDVTVNVTAYGASGPIAEGSSRESVTPRPGGQVSVEVMLSGDAIGEDAGTPDSSSDAVADATVGGAGNTGAAGVGGAPGSGGTTSTGTGGTAMAGTTGAGRDSGIDMVSDAPSEAPVRTPGCNTAGTELCEDFETGKVDSTIWGMQTTGGGSLTVDGTHTHGGKYALHVTLMAGGQSTAQITDAVTFPAKNNTFYTRAFFYFSPDLPADQMGGYHTAYLLATGNNDLGFVEAGLGSAGNKQYLGYSEYYGGGANMRVHGPTFTEFGPESTTMIVPQRWICLELLQGGDATTTHRQVWVDGVELAEQKSDYSGRLPPQFSLMSIGVLQYHPSPILTDVWIDDIRVSSSRIGCTTP